MARGPNWQQIEQIFPIGSIQTGKIFHHAPFGVFLDIGGGDYLGIIQITDFLDEGRMTSELYPVLGSTVTTRVLAYTYDERKQIWLSMKPSIISQI